MQRAGTKSRNQRYERHLVIHRVRIPFGIPRRPARTIGVVRISTKTLHTLALIKMLISQCFSDNIMGYR